MSQAERKPIDPDLFATLEEASRRYKLKDPSMSNDELVRLLELRHELGDHYGAPNCCFYDQSGYFIAIRTKRDEVVIFHAWQMYQRRLESMGAVRIFPEPNQG